MIREHITRYYNDDREHNPIGMKGKVSNGEYIGLYLYYDRQEILWRVKYYL